MGDGPLIEGALAFDTDMVELTARIEAGVPVGNGRDVPMSKWCDMEAALLARLGSGEPGEAVLDREPFDGEGWVDRAVRMCGVEVRSRFDAAVQAIGFGILGALGRPTIDPPVPLGWAESFIRAEQRSAERAVDPMLAAWLSDLIYGMAWAAETDFETARRDFRTRLAVVRNIADRLVDRGTRRDRAIAEGIAAAEIVCESEHWPVGSKD
jgi:hypothetical protein